MINRRNLGINGEFIAARFLEQNGYKLLHTNWRYSRLGELDIVAYQPTKELLSFIEVKTRASKRFGHGIESVTLKKQLRIRQLAEHYLDQFQSALPNFKHISFDVITLTCLNSHTPELEFTPNAF